MFAAEVVSLSGLEPLATGRVRSVYAFPGQPDLLIKVATLQNPQHDYSLGKRLVRHLFPDTIHRNTLKEIECELMAALKLGEDIPGSPLARCLGVVQTDRGPGVAVERISGPDGNLAPHLQQLRKSGGMNDAVLEDLNVFARKLFDLQIVARDIHNKNIVYGHRGGVKAFFLIDGYGERNVVPLRSLSRSLNDRSLHKRLDLIAQKTRLAWHSDRCAFSLR
ncbi:YrbL family protein [Leisingera sp. McT4-56]|uniref:YrbL family protein n=1 Tax=Leisingera sp. McT4-56 TaxID=2881255 RepID=UPI001CF801D9|nr:YrbL family protein [Leisingera sp. McT4-56]MCB4457120.1 PhoP regulatory network YrbL family protein [Leisingera sp. McT4-56]